MAETRKFLVYLDKQVVGVATIEETIEVSSNASEAEIREACLDTIETMIANEIDTGWHEVTPGQSTPEKP